jgi:hypothetical protein
MKGLTAFFVLVALCALYVFNPVISAGLRDFRLAHVANATAEEMSPREREAVSVGVQIYDREQLQEITARVSEQNGVPLVVMEAIIDAESLPAWNQFSFRMEPHLRGQVKHGDAGACSYGLTQVVYGFHSDRCGLTNPVQLYDPEISVACASKVLKACWSKTSGPTKARLAESLKCYNGGSAYSRKVIAAIEEKLFKEVSL